MKLTYATFASPLLYLLCIESEALAATTMSAGCSSTCSSAGNNQICAKSPPVPSPVGLITPRKHAHRSRLLIATRCRWCGATAANHAESSVACKPQSSTLAESSTNVQIMGKGEIRVICISGKLLMWGSATTLIIWLAEESQYQQVGVLDK
ncbi:unnamed protein product [Triticum aestivum]|uniref:Uncharacterized protein n=1 Tax=Triticum aestivum TaxID=4565 RepID=A0A7H4LER5_WHEAT|nr:unnamed protein product [Triticum aestivum]